MHDGMKSDRMGMLRVWIGVREVEEAGTIRERVRLLQEERRPFLGNWMGDGGDDGRETNNWAL